MQDTRIPTAENLAWYMKLYMKLYQTLLQDPKYIEVLQVVAQGTAEAGTSKSTLHISALEEAIAGLTFCKRIKIRKEWCNNGEWSVERHISEQVKRQRRPTTDFNHGGCRYHCSKSWANFGSC